MFIHPSKAHKIVEVYVQPPLGDWLKCNVDDSFVSLKASCGGYFRNLMGDFIFGFGGLVASSSLFHVEPSSMQLILLIILVEPDLV